MRKKKSYNLFQKIRAALRDIYRYSPMRREAIKKVVLKGGLGSDRPYDYFKCPICKGDNYIQMAEVDHQPPLGPLADFSMLDAWANRLYYGDVRVVCKLCHKRVTSEQRKKRTK
jgi:hypothetical protein